MKKFYVVMIVVFFSQVSPLYAVGQTSQYFINVIDQETFSTNCLAADFDIGRLLPGAEELRKESDRGDFRITKQECLVLDRNSSPGHGTQEKQGVEGYIYLLKLYCPAGYVYVGRGVCSPY